MTTSSRLLLYYKGDISALTLFGLHAYGSVCFPDALPKLSSALEPEQCISQKVCVHPAQLVNAVNQLYKLDNDLLQVEQGFNEQIDAPGGVITVYMARFMVLDPPHQLLKPYQCTLKTLPELRLQPPAELELLRRAYVKVMES